jgi:hypothetical protein
MSEYFEHHLQAAVAKYLTERQDKVKDIAFVHIPNEGKRSRKAGNFLKRQGMKPGAPDIIIWQRLINKPARSLHIELKTMTGIQSNAQKDFEAGLTSLGFSYSLVRAETPNQAVDQVHELLR